MIHCVAPDGRILSARNDRRLAYEIERDVRRYTAKQLHELLVSDAVARVATDVRWALAAYKHMGRGRGAEMERAYVDVLDDVEARTGLRLMPGTLP